MPRQTPERGMEMGERRQQVDFPCEGDTLEGQVVDDKAKRLWIACQEPDLSSILEDLEEDTLEKITKVVDNNGMNIFHALLFDKDHERWYTKKLEKEARTKVVSFIEDICQKISEKVIVDMMTVKDNYGRTPLHYAGIIDEEKENTNNSNIVLALLKNGADKTLFVKDRNGETPVSFILTSNLKVHLDTKVTIEGPDGHMEQEAHCDTSILQPTVESNDSSERNHPLNFDCLEELPEKHRDLFDHLVVSAVIW